MPFSWFKVTPSDEQIQVLRLLWLRLTRIDFGSREVGLLDLDAFTETWREPSKLTFGLSITTSSEKANNVEPSNVSLSSCSLEGDRSLAMMLWLFRQEIPHVSPQENLIRD
jgi:hypothetical protein